MNLYFIFDLDYTLYNIKSNLEFDYSFLKKDNYLKFLLNNYPLNKFKKFIFTNAMHIHVDNCLYFMDIPTSTFNNITARDDINDLKPNLSSFYKFKLINNITDFDKCVFFEDTLENLKEAKKIGWKTIFIGPKLIKKYKFVDLEFPNIHLALEFFFNKFN